MGIVILIIIFLIWAVSTIKTESENIDRYNAAGNKYKAEKSTEHGAMAIVYLGIFAVLVLAALIMP